MKKDIQLTDLYFITEDRAEAERLQGAGSRCTFWQKWTAAVIGFLLAMLCTAAIALLPDHTRKT